MEKNLSALGFMSGTSGDGVDSSIISSNGQNNINIKYNRFDPYPASLSKKIHNLKNRILEIQDLLKYSIEISKIALKISKNFEFELIGFHGHTIYHDADIKISKQIGLGNDLSEITKKTVVYDFRQNDIKNGGEGAPLSPIYHLTLMREFYKEKKN